MSDYYSLYLVYECQKLDLAHVKQISHYILSTVWYLTTQHFLLYQIKIAKMHCTYFRTIGSYYINSNQTWHKAFFD